VLLALVKIALSKTESKDVISNKQRSNVLA